MAWILQSSNSAGVVGDSVTVTAPTGIQVGDFLTSCLGANNQDVTFNTPSGWSSANFVTITGGAGNNCGLKYKIADAGDVAAANFTFTSNQPSGSALRAYMQRWTGNDTSSVFDATNKDENPNVDSGSQTFTAGVTQANAGALLIIVGCGEPGTNVAIPQPAVANSNPGTWTKGVADTIFNMWYAERTATGATGDITTAQWPNSGGGTKGGVLMAIFNPAVASGPANLKSLNTNLKANVKSYDTNVIANIKSINTNA